MTVPVDDLKSALRERLRAGRRARDEAERAETERRLAVHLGEVPGIRELVADPSLGCVTAYASFGTEPRTGALRALLAASGVRVLLPVIRDDGLLDWADDSDELSEDGVSKGIPEPTGEAVGTGMAGLLAAGCRVVLAPALGVDAHGNRIGKAGGYYDRLLAGLDDVHDDRRPLVVAVVHDDEVVEEVPAEAHDRPVDGVLTPTGYRPLR